METTSSRALYETLPDTLTPDCAISTSDSQQSIGDMLRKMIPSKDLANAEESLKWNFILDKHAMGKKKSNRPVRKKRQFLTRRERRELDLLKLPKTDWDYAALEPMRQLWQQYMRENLSLVGQQQSVVPQCSDQEWSNFSNIVAKSELIGSELVVVRSKVPSQVGLSGTVVLETKQTFQIVTKSSKLKVIAKMTSVFEFLLDDLRFTVFGKHISIKPGERSVKKIKSQMLPDL